MNYFRTLTVFVLLALFVLLTDLFLEKHTPHRAHLPKTQEPLMFLQ